MNTTTAVPFPEFEFKSVKSNFKTGLRFAEFLGFKNEGLMRGYGPDKSDYYLMAKVYL